MLQGKELLTLAKSVLPQTDKSGWVSMLAGFFSFMFSYGFMRTWPIYFAEITEYLHNNHIDQFEPLYNASHPNVQDTHIFITKTSFVLMFTEKDEKIIKKC